MLGVVPEFPLLGEPLAIDLANTVIRERGREVDLLAERPGVDAWLRHAADRLPAVPDHAPLLELRDALRELFAACTQGRVPDADAVAAINARARQATLTVEATPGGPSTRWDAADQTALALGAIARSAIDVLAGAGGARLRACANPDCLLHFALGDERRTFCSTRTCANRARQARHRARLRAMSDERAFGPDA